MDRKTVGAQPWLRGLMICSLVIGCARPPTQSAVLPAEDGAGDGAARAFEAAPAAAAAFLPIGTDYRVVLASDGMLAAALLGPDRRILGRMAIAAAVGPRESPGVRVEIEDVDGQTMRIEAWSSAGSLYGQAFVGQRSVAWRARLEDDGSLAGESWSLAQRDAVEELVALRRARALGADLGVFATGLSEGCVLAERIALAELALELSVRAWAGHGRSRLPKVGVIDDPCRL
jgi:hypothetical protein